YPSCGELIGAAQAVVAPASRRHLGLLAAGAIVGAAAIAAAVFLRSGDEPAPKAPEGDGVAQIQPSSARIAAYVKTAEAPSNVAVGDGAVWFLADDARTVARIDPKSHAVTKRIRSPGAATDLTVGAGAVWVGTGGGAGGNWTDTVHRIDP